MNQREQTMALALGGVVALLAGRWLVMDVVLAPIRERQARLERADEDLEHKQEASAIQQAAIDSLRKWKLGALPESQNGGNASVLYKGYLVDLLQKAGIKNPTITPLPIRKTRNAYSTLPFSIAAQCELGQLSKMLFDFQRTDLLHAIKMIDVRPQINSQTDKIEHLDAKIDIEVLAFADASGRTSLEPGGKPDGRKLEEFQFLAKKNFFQPTSLVPVNSVVQSEKDDRSSVTFNGTSIQSGEGHRSVESFYFYHNGGPKPFFALAKGETLDIANFKGKILGYDAETQEVIFESSGKILGVKSGKTISTAKERSKPPAALSLASQPNL